MNDSPTHDKKTSFILVQRIVQISLLCLLNITPTFAVIFCVSAILRTVPTVPNTKDRYLFNIGQMLSMIFNL